MHSSEKSSMAKIKELNCNSTSISVKTPRVKNNQNCNKTAMWSVVKQWLNEEQNNRVSFMTEAKMHSAIIPQQIISLEDENIWKCPSNPKKNPGTTCTDVKDSSVKQNSNTIAVTSSSELLKLEASNTKFDKLNTEKSSTTISTVSLNCQLHSSAQPTGNRNVVSSNTRTCVNITNLLLISPSETLDFDLQHENINEKKFTTKLTLTNATEENNSTFITFKIKTNSPEKFFVKPNIGVIPSGEEAVLLISLDQTKISSINNDKFLILFDKFSGSTCENLSNMWKEKEMKTNFMQHRLKVRLFNIKDFKNATVSKKANCSNQLRLRHVHFTPAIENQESVQFREFLESGKMKLVAGIFCLILFFILVFSLCPTGSSSGWEKPPRYIPLSDTSQQ